jgi:hypothetical protein
MAYKICLFTDIEIPLDTNVIQKGAEKKLKYKNQNMEIQ